VIAPTRLRSACTRLAIAPTSVRFAPINHEIGFKHLRSRRDHVAVDANRALEQSIRSCVESICSRVGVIGSCVESIRSRVGAIDWLVEAIGSLVESIRVQTCI
jgi:hypothetical protein